MQQVQDHPLASSSAQVPDSGSSQQLQSGASTSQHAEPSSSQHKPAPQRVQQLNSLEIPDDLSLRFRAILEEEAYLQQGVHQEQSDGTCVNEAGPGNPESLSPVSRELMELTRSPEPSQQIPIREAADVDYPALRVRRQVFRRLWFGIGTLGVFQRLGFALKSLLVFAQLVAFIVILALSHKDSCDEPLRVFLGLHTVRVGINYPPYLYNKLSPSPRSEATLEEREQLERNRTFGNSAVDRKVKRLATFSACSALVIFIFGNWAWSTSDTCRRTSPLLYWGSLAALCVGYLYIFQVIAIAFLVIFALPLVMIWASLFGITKKHEIKSINQKDVDKIPLVLYVPADTTEALPEETTAPTLSRVSSRSSQKQAKKHSKLQRLFSRARSTPKQVNLGASNTSENRLRDYLPGPHPFYPLPENLTACPICLCDFEEPPLKAQATESSKVAWEPLRLLPCGHVLHRDCLDPWLTGSSGRCPVCQASVKKGPSANAQRNNENPTSSTTHPNTEPV